MVIQPATEYNLIMMNSINNSEIKYRLIRSNRKTISITVDREGNVIVKAPTYADRVRIERFINDKRDWILKNVKKQKEKASSLECVGKLSPKELRNYGEITLSRIQPYLLQYSAFYGVTYNRVTIRSQKTRWGSCSSKKNLNFNCMLAAVPDRVVKYVVVHELCHLLEMNHSKKFWALVERAIPDYKTDVKWLKNNGGQLISRIP